MKRKITKEELKVMLKKKYVTLRKAARQLDISPEQLDTVINGGRNTDHIIKKISKCLNLDVNKIAKW